MGKTRESCVAWADAPSHVLKYLVSGARTGPLISKSPTRNSAIDFRGNKKLGSGYTDVSAERVRSPIRTSARARIPASYDRADTERLHVLMAQNGLGKVVVCRHNTLISGRAPRPTRGR